MLIWRRWLERSRLDSSMRYVVLEWDSAEFPEAELRNNSEKVKVSIRVLSHAGILILA